jgi:hypothetical protein
MPLVKVSLTLWSLLAWRDKRIHFSNGVRKRKKAHSATTVLKNDRIMSDKPPVS